MENITLNTGAVMPSIGLGTWKSAPNLVGNAVRYAIEEAGYRHIDGAAVYRNELEIGEAYHAIFVKGSVRRDELFITSKLWNTAHDTTDVEKACKQTLHDLQLDYLDLYLMHWAIAENADGSTRSPEGKIVLPKISVRETWEAMQDLVSAGLVRAIGVSNFTGLSLIDLLSYAKVVPAVNQIELHPYLQQSRLVSFCQEQGIAVTGYSPLGSPGNRKEGQPMLINDPVVAELAEKYQKSSSQILLRFAIQRGIATIPKSTTPENIKHNMQIFDFNLSPADMLKISALECHHRFVDYYNWSKIPYFD